MRRRYCYRYSCSGVGFSSDSSLCRMGFTVVYSGQIVRRLRFYRHNSLFDGFVSSRIGNSVCKCILSRFTCIYTFRLDCKNIDGYIFIIGYRNTCYGIKNRIMLNADITATDKYRGIIYIVESKYIILFLNGLYGILTWYYSILSTFGQRSYITVSERQTVNLRFQSRYGLDRVVSVCKPDAVVYRVLIVNRYLYAAFIG